MSAVLRFVAYNLTYVREEEVEIRTQQRVAKGFCRLGMTLIRA
jgi:hypothetical protein